MQHPLLPDIVGLQCAKPLSVCWLRRNQQSWGSLSALTLPSPSCSPWYQVYPAFPGTGIWLWMKARLCLALWIQQYLRHLPLPWIPALQTVTQHLTWGHQDGTNKKTGYVVAAPTCGAHGWHRQAVRGSLQGSIHSPKNPQGTGGGELGKRRGRGKENSFPRARSYSKQNSWKAQARCSQSTRECCSLETVLGLQRSALPGWLSGWRA